MSYYTRIEFTFSDDRPEVEAILDRARTYLESRSEQYPNVPFILDQLRGALEADAGDFKGPWSDDIEGLMRHVSAGFPGLIFFVRGMGEEFPDVWLRLFRDGKILFRAGPFEDELDEALGEI